MNRGAKAQNLLELRSLYPDKVPPFEVVPFHQTIQAYPAMADRINDLVAQAVAHKIPPAALKAELAAMAESVKPSQAGLNKYHTKLSDHGWGKVSFRTSALSEDGEEQSFAGQYVSFVDVTYSRETLEQYVVACFRSLFSDRVVQYVTTHDIRTFTIGGSVIVQRMFYGRNSGVLFTEDGQGQLTFAIAGSWRNTVVEGHDATIVKVSRVTLKGRGMNRQLREIARLGIALDQRSGRPLDLEWAYDGEGVRLLQMRPLTTPTTNYTLTWDATNISENYPGITLPLTYSFIKHVYAQVYPSFFRLMGMSRRKLEQHSSIFENTLGYINGRVYYRIDNWYELVSLIPGSRNREFFEAMLNPVSKRADSAAAPKSKAAPVNLMFGLLALRFTWLLFRSEHSSRLFTQTFTRKFVQYNRLDWTGMTAQAAWGRLREIRRELLVLWGVPILNDVRVMIFHGIFKTILFKDADNATYLRHLQGLSDRASIQPLEALHALGVQLDQAMRQAHVTELEAVQTTKAWDDIKMAAQAFIDSFGGRTPDELQLENPRLSEDIWNVLHLAYASKGAQLPAEAAGRPGFGAMPWPKRLLAGWVAHQVRRAIDHRERFRFNRAQVFGLARTAFLAIGEKMAAAKVIHDREDIFWLTEQEIEAVVEGHSWSYDLRTIVAGRKREYAAYRQQAFWMRAAGVGVIAPAEVAAAMPDQLSARGIAGRGVAPGKVTAPVVVVEAFDPKLDVANKILVVRHVDPGWTLLLVQAAGVITEQGNPLSHVAIVAREIAIPAVVGIRDAVGRFQTGDRVTMDGSTGEVWHEA